MTCPLDVSAIIPGQLYQGSMPPPDGSVRACKFDTLVLCAQEYQPPEVLFEGVSVLYCPMDDAELTRDEAKRARETAAHVTKLVTSGKRVLVTCVAGRNRSGLVMALTVRAVTGWPMGRVVAYIRQRRTNALTNASFLRALGRTG